MGTFKNPDVWKQNLAYQIGDFVLYDGTVYMAIKPVPAGTTMQSEYWTAFDTSAVVPNIDIEITENGIYNAEMWKSATVNVEGGGGGSVDLGELNSNIYVITDENPAPVVDGSLIVYPNAFFEEVFIGESVVAGQTSAIAAGASGLLSDPLLTEQPTAYLVTAHPITLDITAVETTTIEYSIVAIDETLFLKLVIPEPDPDGRYLLIGTFGGGK